MKNMLKAIQTFWAGLNKVNRFIGFLFLAGIVYCIGGQIFSRWLAGKVWAWAEEVAEVFLIGTIVLFNGYAEQTDEHVRLEALFSIFPKIKGRMLQLGRFFTMIMCAFIVYTEVLFIPQILKGTTKVARIPLPLIHGMILVGFIFYFIDVAVNCWKHWKGIPFGLEDTSDADGAIFDEDPGVSKEGE